VITFRPEAPGPSFELPVRGIQYLAGSEQESFPLTVPDAGGMIPALRAHDTRGGVGRLAAAVREVVEANLAEFGGVHLRGLPLTSKEDFEQLVAALGYPAMGYTGGIAVRPRNTGLSLVTSEEDRRITMSPHNEMAYLPSYPGKVIFFCLHPAHEGGEVPVNDIRDTPGLLPAGLREELRERGIRYFRHLPRESSTGETGWADTFGSSDQATVSDQLAEAGYQVEWGPGDHLRYSYVRSAFVDHPVTGEALWFNQVTEMHASYWRSHPGFRGDLPDDAYPATTAYGDGTPFEEEQISLLRGALWRTTRAVRMSQGSVLVLDNQVIQHGRFAYRGPRRHYVSLAR
jgi:alpha-ketoglutarate-dependent taurine dioxygenase